MRVSLLWGPAIILLNIVFYAAAIASVTYLPIHLFGFGGYGRIIAAIIALIAFIWLSSLAEAAFKDWLYQRKVNRIMREDASATEVAPTINKGPSFASVVVTYAAATKQKICPTITFKQ